MLVINKYNYKGYVELYNIKDSIDSWEFKYQKKMCKNSGLIFIIGSLLIAATSALESFNLISSIHC